MFSISASIAVMRSYNKTDDEIMDIIKALKINNHIKNGYIEQRILDTYL